MSNKIKYCCDQFKNLEIWGENTEQAYILQEDFDGRTRTVNINFCPNCGVKLE